MRPTVSLGSLCVGKILFSSWSSASDQVKRQRFRNRNRKRDEIVSQVYWCQMCRAFHTGRDMRPR